ncbi:hypothetical protein ES332_A08G154500v1 [Gossypium tomentosum]|uniref:Transmembrane protein n=1 Tax=Gossypium tomentosum TaxID=34277 RepID=A0A5D2PFX3_GOSTO|nr:hypothetical protein ES332_A08G154500v1 [Gossypium tomentosum]
MVAMEAFTFGHGNWIACVSKVCWVGSQRRSHHTILLLIFGIFTLWGLVYGMYKLECLCI